HDSKPARVVLNRLKCHLGRIWVPTRRMNDGGIDTPFIHQDDGLFRGEGRHLSMREVAWQAGSPEVNLGVDDLHDTISSFLRIGQSTPAARSGMLATIRLAVSCPAGGSASSNGPNTGAVVQSQYELGHYILVRGSRIPF